MHVDAKKPRMTPPSAGWLVLIGLLCVGSAQAQIVIGDNLQLKMNGSLGAGYSATFGDSGSAHSQNIVGSGAITGSYHNPGFISFAVRPFWDRAKSNNDSGAINRDSGLDSSVSLFGGSNMPLSFSYGKAFGSTNEFGGLAGVGGLETHGTGQSMAVTWSESLPNLPPVYASYSISSAAFSALGTNGDSHNSGRNFNFGSNYKLFGFHLAGTFSHGSANYTYSDLLGFASTGNSASTSYGVSAQHPLPLRGGLNVSLSHSTYGNSGNGGAGGSTSSLSAGSSFMPWSRLSISAQSQYTTNLSAAIRQELLPGSSVAILNSDSASHSLTLSGGASVNIGHGWGANTSVGRVSSSYLGYSSVSTQFSGLVNYQYSHNFFGMLRFGGGLVDMAGKQGNSGVALVGNLGMDRRVGRWNTSADFSYSQDVQTLYGIATTSNYNYGASIRRKFNDTTYWSGSFRAAHSGLTHSAGSSSASESISNSFSWRRYSVSGSYSQSQGTSVITALGVLTPVVGAGLFTNDFMLFNGRSLSVSGATRLFRRINVSGSYAKSHSNIDAQSVSTFTESQIYNAHADYRLRKMTLSGGYSRVSQQATAIKNGPFMLNSFYVSFSRWFNVF